MGILHSRSISPPTPAAPMWAMRPVIAVADLNRSFGCLNEYLPSLPANPLAPWRVPPLYPSICVHNTPTQDHFTLLTHPHVSPPSSPLLGPDQSEPLAVQDRALSTVCRDRWYVQVRRQVPGGCVHEIWKEWIMFCVVASPRHLFDFACRSQDSAKMSHPVTRD